MPLPSSRPAAPFAGLTFLNTREANAAEALTAELTARGARVIACPTIAFAPPASWGPFDARLAELAPGDWLAFTSATAVSAFANRLRELGPRVALPDGVCVAAVGTATAQAVTDAGLPVHLVPEQFQGEGLLAALTARLAPGARVWLPRAEAARETLVEGLRAAGIGVDVTPVYRTVAPERLPREALAALAAGEVDWLLFTSPSTVRNFLALLPGSRADLLAPGRPRVACLGAVTAQAAEAAGLTVSVVPERQDLPGLLAALEAHLGAATEPTP